LKTNKHGHGNNDLWLIFKLNCAASRIEGTIGSISGSEASGEASDDNEEDSEDEPGMEE